MDSAIDLEMIQANTTSVTFGSLEAGVQYLVSVQAFLDLPGPKSDEITITLNGSILRFCGVYL